MSTVLHPISVKGHIRHVPAFRFDDAVVVVSGTALRVATIFDAYWLEAATLPDPRHVIERLKQADDKPDLFTFTQRVPDTEPRFEFHLEWDNVATIPVSSYDHWFQKQVSSATRRNIRASEKKGVVVRVQPFDETYIRGIMSISDESPIRAGRRYWHYGKDFATVSAEQGTYRDRSSYLAAYRDDEMIGYLKIVWDARSAAIMQIVSKLKHLDRRPNNALLAAAVKLAAERGVDHLLYERFVYGKKVDSSLTRFKKENGFVRMDLPSYVVPLTPKGRMALRLGLHRSVKDRLPLWLTTRLIDARDKWHAHRSQQNNQPGVVSSGS